MPPATADKRLRRAVQGWLRSREGRAAPQRCQGCRRPAGPRRRAGRTAVREGPLGVHRPRPHGDSDAPWPRVSASIGHLQLARPSSSCWTRRPCGRGGTGGEHQERARWPVTRSALLIRAGGSPGWTRGCRAGRGGSCPSRSSSAALLWINPCQDEGRRRAGGTAVVRGQPVRIAGRVGCRRRVGAGRPVSRASARRAAEDSRFARRAGPALR